MAAPERKHTLEMIGEFCREAGVLVGVFGFLDKFLRQAGADVPFWELAVGITMTSIVLVGTGIWIERKRPIK